VGELRTDRLPPHLIVTNIAKKIVRRDGQWCVTTADGSETLGCHDTEAAAQRQLRAIEMNKVNTTTAGEMSLEFSISKTSPTKREVYGWANVAVMSDDGGDLVPVIDGQGDVIPAAELESALHKYTETDGGTGVDHVGPKRGELIEAMVFSPDKVGAMFGPLPDGSPGLLTESVLADLHAAGTVAEAVEVLKRAIGVRAWVAYRVDPVTFARVESGELDAFSIQGRADSDLVEVAP
jgi:hypothetical protein